MTAELDGTPMLGLSSNLHGPEGAPLFRIGIDTGGTFTDVVAIGEESGVVVSTKTPSTPNDPSQALIEGIDKVIQGQSASIAAIHHGTTVATNQLLEEQFTSLGLITTRGFRHVLEIARQSVPDGYGNSYFWVKPDRIVPLQFVREVTERLGFTGDVRTPLDETEARNVARWFRDRGIMSIGVCFIHAYANGAHERRMRDILTEEHPEAIVSLSSDVLPEYREYERTVTTLVDAVVKPSVRVYVQRAEHEVQSLGGDCPFLIMQSNGGVLSPLQVARRPISTLLSGPAAGVLGASLMAGAAGFPNILTVDAGGTSTDICLVENGEPHITTEGSVGRFPVKVPMIDIITIGTGGGSIAWVDPSGSLRVGPRSAGASPGPMCYGNGGENPTLTDANVVLGRLPPCLLGGEISLDVDRARFGLERVGRQLEMDPIRLAAGILEIADWNQVNAVRQVTVKKGLDPREYTMVAFGGSGPLQAGRVAQLLNLPYTLIPPRPGNVSAYGLLAADMKMDFVATAVQREDALQPPVLMDVLGRLEAEAVRRLTEEGVTSERQQLVRSADLRYFGEAYEVRIDLPAGQLDASTFRGAIERFHTEHERLYGYSYRGSQLTEFVNLRVIGVGLMARPRIAEVNHHEEDVPQVGSRPVYFGDGFLDCRVYSRASLHPGTQFSGPAVVEEYGSTFALQPEQRLSVDGFGNLLIEPEP